MKYSKLLTLAFFFVMNAHCSKEKTCEGPSDQLKPECMGANKSPAFHPPSTPEPQEQPSKTPPQPPCPGHKTLDQSHVFVTKDSFQGNFGGVEAADKICQKAAAAAKLEGKFAAWLSDDKHSPRNRKAFCSLWDFKGPFKRVDGNTLARGWEELTTFELRQPPYMNEFAHSADSIVVWSNTTAQGDLHRENEDCLNWKSSSPVAKGGIGVNNSYKEWSTKGLRSCDKKAHLYCFEIAE